MLSLAPWVVTRPSIKANLRGERLSGESTDAGAEASQAVNLASLNDEFEIGVERSLILDLPDKEEGATTEGHQLEV